MVESAVQLQAEIIVDSTEKPKIRVLHVDDELGLLKVAKQCLELQGPFQVDTAGSVEEALNKLKEKEYDAVVSDYKMPCKDGLEFLEELRKSDNKIPFILFTGKGREEVAAKALNLGADQYLNKAGDSETVYHELAHNITWTVEKKRAEKALRESLMELNLVLSTLEEGVDIVGYDYVVQYQNKLLKDRFGDLTGKMCYVEYMGLKEPCPFCPMRKAIEHKKTFRVEVTGKDGRGYELISMPLEREDGGVDALEVIRDITERKKAEQESFDRQMMLQSVFDASPNALLIIDLNGKILDCNEEALEIFGYSSKSELVGRSALESIAEGDLQRAMENMEKTLKQGLMRNEEYTIIAKNNSKYTLSVSASVLRDASGNPIGFVSAIEDLSSRKKMEETLRKSGAKYRALVEQSMQGIVIAHAQGSIPHIAFANSAMSKILGYSVEELTSLSTQQTIGLVHPDDRELFFGRFKDRLEGKSAPPQYEVRGIRKDGTVVWMELSSARIEYDGQPAVQAIVTDITERKKTEQTLKESEEKYRNLVELAPDGIVAVNVEGIITSANRSFLTLVGYDSEEEIVGKPFTELMTMRMDDIPKFQGMFKSLMKGESPSPSEFLYVRRDGTSRWAEVHPSLMIKDGYPAGVQAIMRDVSERKNAEKLVQESHQKFEGLFRRNPEAAVYLDLNFRIVDANPRFCQLFGYPAEEVKGRNINDVVAPEGMREEAESLDKDAKNGYASHNTVRKRKDGSLVHVSISAAPVTFENNLLGYVGIYKDITELKRAQEESEESRKHFQMLFDLMADPVAVVDGRGKILEVTRKAEEITGFKKEELVGRNLLKIEMFGAKTKAVMIKSLAKRMMGMHVEPYEVEVLKKDGGKLVYEINAARIDYKGKPADLVVFRDILERKNLEEKLRVVGSLTRHDVRNKLSAVTGNAYLLKRKLAGNPEALEQLVDMENAVRNVETILEFARAYEKLGVEQLAYVDMKKTVDEAVGMLPGLQGVKIVNECEGLTLLADSLLRQLFYNLIDDSLRYGEKLAQIRIRYEKSENQLRLVYEDDGVGISKNVKAKLFTEGFTTGKGSGYGLYLIRRMMDVYGWTINETGTHGKGAQFTINIPEARPDGRQNYKLG
jgi:PAS domain S-box-containing protein